MAKATPKLEQRKDPATGQLKQLNIPILIDFSFGGTRLWLQTGENIDRKMWDEKNHRVKPNYLGSVEINAIVASKCDHINKIYRDMILAGKQPTVSSIRSALNRNDKRDKKTLMQHYEDFIDGYRIKGSLGTVKKLKTNLEHLKSFGKYAKISLDFDAIDNIFFNRYIEYFLIDKKHTNGTIARNVKVLKWFLNYCSKLGYNKKFDFKSFSYKHTEPKIIALKEDEILKICNFKTNNVCLAQVRDCFLFMCYTALRYGDAKELRKIDIDGDFINITSQKTKSEQRIPLIDAAKTLLKKYSENYGTKAMPFISNQKMNEYLKEIGKLAGLNRVVTKIKYRGNQPIENVYEFHEVLTCHVARRTFVSYMFFKNVDTELIRSITNHKSMAVFARYNQIDEQHKAREMKIAFKKVV
ncbi:tyrosine-type recombinase/integrase [Pedobacter sp. ASV1-7]|uniref:tyrosine-type recombinase/integrase n=1 Tax=Pedobacter sp. ASV1-7 TaxID=3145237 RepID=UPI0032E8FF5D